MDISSIIPTFNEEQEIAPTLNSIRESASALGLSHEIIVVDNGSNDLTIEIAKELADLVVLEPTKTIGGMRNTGASFAKGAVLVFNDADVRLTQEWVKKFDSCFRDYLSQAIVVGGALIVPDTRNLIHKYWFKPLLRNKESKGVNYVGTGNMIVRKDLFIENKGFDERLVTGEDYDFCVRMKKNGAIILYDVDLKAIHAGYPIDVKGFFRREFWHGKGDFQTIDTILSSKTALFSIMFILINMFFLIFLALGKYYTSGCVFLVFSLLLLYFSLYKVPSRIGFYGRVFHVGLSFLYLWARGLSFLGNIKVPR